MANIELSLKNVKQVQEGLKDKEAQLMKAVNATTKDFKSRGPGWISQEVTNIYTVKKKDVTQSKRGARKNGITTVAGIKLDNIELKYRGSLMTPVHFKMTPKKRPVKPQYRVAAEIKKGNKTRLPNGVFLGDNGHGTQIPWQREKQTRLPIKSIKSVSVPQMITNKDVADNIRKRLDKELGKRLEHNIQRMNEK